MNYFALLLASLCLIAPADAGDVNVDGLLAKMHEAGRDVQTMSAKVRLTDYDFNTGEEVVRPGRLALRRGDAPAEAAVYIVFTGRESDRGFEVEKIEYLFADGQLIDRNHRVKSQVIRKLPPEQLERDPFALGDGPFPILIGQDPARVRALFEIKLVNPAVAAENDLEVDAVADTVRLRLTPLPETQFADQYERIEVDVDPATGLARQVITFDKPEVNLRIAELTEIARDTELKQDAFELEDVDLADGWNVSVEDLNKPKE